MAFLTKLQTEKVRNGSAFGRAKWRVLSPLVFESAIVGTVTVPADFETDLASVPRLPLVYLFTGDTAHAAAVVHDYLTRTMPWALAAKVFREAMHAESEPQWRIAAMYWAVRVAKPVTKGVFIMRLAILALVVLALTGCSSGPMFKGELDNVLTVTLPQAGEKPRAFANSTWWRLSLGAELREEDAQALADLIRIRAEHELLLRMLAQQSQGRSAVQTTK